MCYVLFDSIIYLITDEASVDALIPILTLVILQIFGSFFNKKSQIFDISR